MTELIRLDAVTLGAKIAAKEVSSTEVTQAHLDQISITDDRYHFSFRRTIFCTDGCRQSKTHCAQTTGSNIAFRLIEFCIAASHHLVLANIGNNYSIAIC